MAVFKNNLDRDYVKIPNGIITDLRITPSEFRMYCYISSKPGTWEINNKDIMKQLGIKTRSTISSHWKKLTKLKLLKRTLSEKKKGMFDGYDYELLPYSLSPCTSSPCTVHSDTEALRHGTTSTHSKTELLSNTDIKSKTDIKTTEKSKTDFSREVFETYEFCLNFFPEFSKPTNPNDWLSVIEKLHRIEKVEFEVIKYLVQKTREDAFWSKNFLSLTKLRKKNPDGIKYIFSFAEKFKPKEATVGRQTLSDLEANSKGW